MNRHPDSYHRPRNYYLGAAALVMIGLVLGLGLSASLHLQPVSTAERNGAAVFAQDPGAALTESPFAAVVERTLPAVVFVDVKKKVAAGDSDDPQDETRLENLAELVAVAREFADEPTAGPSAEPEAASGASFFCGPLPEPARG